MSSQTSTTDPLPPEREGESDRFMRWVSVCAVLATFTAAVAGFLQASATRSADRATALAQQRSVEGTGERVRSQQVAQLGMKLFQQAREYGAQQANSYHRLVFDAGNREEALGENRRAQELLARTESDLKRMVAEENLSDITRGGRDAPEADPLFPTRFLQRQTQEAVELFALRDAANDESSAWTKAATAYVACLALLAVALYLFGFSLTSHGRDLRGLFATVGLIFALAAAAWAGLTAVFKPQRAPPAAAAAFAEGSVMLATAAGPAEYRRACERLTDAIELRPYFARAYAARALGSFNAAACERSPSPQAAARAGAKAAVADYRMAYGLGLRTRTITNDLGVSLFRLGLASGDRDERVELLRESAARYADSNERQPGDPLPRFNRAASLLAAGDVETARRTYADAISSSFYATYARRNPGTTIGAHNELVKKWTSAALTGLEQIERAGNAVDREIGPIKEMVIGSFGRGRLGPPRTRASIDASYYVYPSGVETTINGTRSLDARRQAVVQHWYRHEPGAGWFHLAPISGPISDRLRDPSEDAIFLSYLGTTVPPACLTEGRYRVELYVDGKLVDRRVMGTDHGEVDPYIDSLTGLSGCRPRDWSISEVDASTLSRGFVSRDRRSGIYTARLSDVFGGTPSVRRTTVILDRTLRRLGRPIPARAKPVRGKPYETLFSGLEHQSVRAYRHPAGRILAVAGQRRFDGSMLIGLVFRPTTRFEYDPIFESFVPR